MLFWIQFASAVASVALAILWANQYRSPATVLALTGLGGVLMGFGMPAWQGFVADLVPRESLPAAVTMNSVQFLGTAVIGFGLSPTYPVGAACVLVAGSTAVGSGVLLLTAVQTHVDDAFRGRVLGAYGMAFTASYPLGSLAQGASADLIGARANEIVVGSVILAATGLLMANRRWLDALDAPVPSCASPFCATEPSLIRWSSRERPCPTGHRG